MTATPDPISKLVVASHNEGKVREIRDLLAPFGVETVSLSELGLPVPEETEDTFAGNAALKAQAACDATGLSALADDSGLAVAALDGAPGVVSADWAGEPRDFDRAMARVEAELAASGSPDRSASFHCALALAEPGRPVQIFDGRVDGELVSPPRGSRGFGYDPMFVARGQTLTFGEMEPAAKHAMSHRADAFAKLLAARFGV